jgi:rfaE bifunctional protein kinase chain/domain
MKQRTLSPSRVKQILAAATKTRALVIGDVMLDHFIWGQVGRISPEAPVPVVDFVRESFIPGGAANVARNLTALSTPTELFGAIGRDSSATQLKQLLTEYQIVCEGLLSHEARPTSVKTRIVAHQQQVVRLDRETRSSLDAPTTRQLLALVEARIKGAAAVIVGDYGKGVITQPMLDELKQLCRRHGVWLSLDPKPVHRLNLTGLSLITPNRKEAFERRGHRGGQGRHGDDHAVRIIGQL